MGAEDVGRVEGEELVPVEEPSLLVHGADAVGVAVESDPEIGPGLTHPFLKGAHQLGHRGIGEMVRKASVRLREDRVHVAPERAKELGPQDARGAVSWIHDDPKLALQRDPGDEIAQVVLVHGSSGHRPALRRHRRRADPVSHVLDLRAVQRGDPVRQLEPVVLDRVVASGHHDAAVRLEVEDREVEPRRRNLPHVEHVRARVAESLDQRRLDPRRGKPDVAPHRERLLPALAHELGERGADRTHDVVRQISIGQATDIVLAEDLRIRRAHGVSFSLR